MKFSALLAAIEEDVDRETAELARKEPELAAEALTRRAAELDEQAERATGWDQGDERATLTALADNCRLFVAELYKRVAQLEAA